MASRESEPIDASNEQSSTAPVVPLQVPAPAPISMPGEPAEVEVDPPASTPTLPSSLSPSEPPPSPDSTTAETAPPETAPQPDSDDLGLGQDINRSMTVKLPQPVYETPAGEVEDKTDAHELDAHDLDADHLDAHDLDAPDVASNETAPSLQLSTLKASILDPPVEVPPHDAPTDVPPPMVNDQGFAPPSIPGVREEVTRPLRISPLSDDGEAIDDSAHASEATDSLLDELGPLTEKTVDIDLPLLTKEMEVGSPSTEESRTIEGAPPLDDRNLGASTPPAAGTVFKSDAGEDVTLTVSLGDQRGSVFYRATIEGEEPPYTAVWTPNPRPEPPWTSLPDPRVVRPRAVARLDNAAIRVFERPKGNTVVDYLLDQDRFLPAMATLELGLELAEMLESLHGAGLFLYDLDPSQVVIEKSGRVRLYPISGFYRAGEMPRVGSGTFAAPEVRRGLRYRVGAHSDVFAVALVLYALLARRSPLEEDLDPAQLVNPRTFRPECPLGIWPHLQACLAPVANERVGHARGLRSLLEKARDRLLQEARAADDPAPVVLEAWAEVHTGLAKARRGAPQQDRAIGVTDEEGTVGLYLIADGVSRSKFGDGAFAAEQVKQASYQRWTALEKAGPAALALSHAQRQDVLRQISRSAGKRVAAEVNSHWAPIPNEPNQVMSSTLVAAFVVGGEATIANLGDSRAYLVRKGEIEQISIDHDRTTDGLRMGLSFKEAGEMRMGSALTRVVGRVIIDDEGGCRPDPFEPEVFRLRLLPGDRLVLCSDGVADFAAGPGAPTILAEHAMRDVVEEFEDPVRAAFELVVLANRAGGYDNISCVVIAAHPG